MTGARRTSTEGVRQWRAENPERASSANRDAIRRYRDGSRQKWAEIARKAAEEAAAEPDAPRAPGETP
jgi:hypothetical protein